LRSPSEIPEIKHEDFLAHHNKSNEHSDANSNSFKLPSKSMPMMNCKITNPADKNARKAR